MSATLGYIVLLAVTVVVFAFVLQPLLSARRRPVSIPPARLADLQARRAYLLDAIREVDFDYSMGKVTEAEYQEVRGRYLREAAEVLRELERESSAVDAEIEREIARLQELAREPGRSVTERDGAADVS
ncbi:hypothetical protein [Sphaerobacter sp.]|uniref:hypothetical protein n=1 Tax=Sphaerobacter sp. TaxID=2099654 RepID=UPI001DC69564|nr:hypothetical protein [Sphaerobacter sp.]MBX5444026.1 hypothetical protein [Sphaerobacter sp.]